MLAWLAPPASAVTVRRSLTPPLRERASCPRRWLLVVFALTSLRKRGAEDFLAQPERGALPHEREHALERGKFAFGFGPEQDAKRAGVANAEGVGRAAALRVIHEQERVGQFHRQGQRLGFSRLQIEGQRLDGREAGGRAKDQPAGFAGVPGFLGAVGFRCVRDFMPDFRGT